VRATIGTGGQGELGLTYYQAGLWSDSPGNGRAQIYGADWKGDFGSLGIDAEYAKSVPNDTMLDTLYVEDNNNDAWKAMLNFKLGNLALNAGYIDVGYYFFAPGNWLKTGAAVNLQNIKGWLAGLQLPLGSKLGLTAGAQFL